MWAPLRILFTLLGVSRKLVTGLHVTHLIYISLLWKNGTFSAKARNLCLWS